MGTNAGTLAVFFGGKRIGLTQSGSTSAFTQDRLGSNGSYYPYGEAHGTVPQDQVGFATYTNDSATGLQYADQRYYASNWGRFMSPDRAQGAPNQPSSWNRYAYTQADPVNGYDPHGRYAQVPGSDDGSDLPCVGLDDPVDTPWCFPTIESPTPKDVRAKVIDYWASDVLGGVIESWDFSNAADTAISGITSPDYYEFITYLQECACDDIYWNNVFTLQKNLAFTFTSAGAAIIQDLQKIFKKDDPIKRPACGLPTGTKPIDQMGWDKERIHEIKDGVGARPQDWVGVDPQGNVWTGTPSGDAENHGPWEQYSHH